MFLASLPAVATDSPPATRGRIPTGDGVELFYQVDGQGSETLVVLHGGPGFNLLSLQPDLQPLAKNHRVIYYVQRGAGRSTVSSDAMLINLD